MKAAHVTPSAQQMGAAFERLRKPHWPATLDEALADHNRRILITGLARSMAREALDAPPPPPAPARLVRPPRSGWRFDARKAAANDRDD